MLDVALTELIKASVSVAKDILGNLVKEKNEELLEKKRKREKEKKRKRRSNKLGLEKEELSKIFLRPEEEITATIILEENVARKNILKHLERIKQWCEYISFKDLQGDKRLSDIYIELDTYLMPLRTHISKSERQSIKPLQEALFSDERHAVVLGSPGAGKTTSMKKLCSNYFSGSLTGDYNFPVLVRFRDLNAKGYDNSINSHLREILEVDVDISKSTESEMKEKWRDEALYTIVNELKPVIILDGFDELPTQSQKDLALSEIRAFTTNCKGAKIIITCRTGEFNYQLDFTNDFEISSLREEQVFNFAQKWIGDAKKAEKFVEDVNHSPFADTTIKPLSLAHLCAIYERTKKIPDRPKSVYRKIVNLLLEEWDNQRSIERKSRYAKFESDRKFEFLSNLSYYFTINRNTALFTPQQLIDAYSSICSNFGLPKDESVLVANEIESHTGLFLQTGYEQYEFAHKSLQEYLTAEYLVKLPSLDEALKHIELLGAELAIATSISSNPSLYFTHIVLGLFNRADLTDSFYNAFVSRLIQERPDFYPSNEMVLASFSLLAKHPDDEKYLLLMEEMLRNNKMESIVDNYRIEVKYSNGGLMLRRMFQHQTYKLPSELFVPNSKYSQHLKELYEPES